MGIPAAGNSDHAAVKRRSLGRPFKPGQSGNPSGRPKKKPITEMFEKLLEDTGNMELVAKSVLATLQEKGMAKVLLLDKMADRVEGKVREEIAMTVTEGLAERVSRFRSKKAK